MSKTGHMPHQSSVFADVSTTNGGIVNDVMGSDKAFAVVAGPRLVSGDKHGAVAAGVVQPCAELPALGSGERVHFSF